MIGCQPQLAETRMPNIDLPRALEDYFAFAETAPTSKGRRFSITLPYQDHTGRLDRLQWWYHINTVQERLIGDGGIAELRAKAIEGFRRHIDRWLENTRQRLYGAGSEPIPRIGALLTTVNTPAVAAEPPIDPPQWPAEKVANG
jgi:hypothetical protein